MPYLVSDTKRGFLCNGFLEEHPLDWPQKNPKNARFGCYVYDCNWGPIRRGECEMLCFFSKPTDDDLKLARQRYYARNPKAAPLESPKS